MWDAEKDDDAAFEQRLEPIVREIGDRGRAPEPQSWAAPAAPAPAPAPAPAASQQRLHHGFTAPPPPVMTPHPPREPQPSPAPGSTYTAPSLQPAGGGAAAAAGTPEQLLLDSSSRALSLSHMTAAAATSGGGHMSEMFYLQLERERVSAERERADRVDRMERCAEKRLFCAILYDIVPKRSDQFTKTGSGQT
jgi:hypothetical protein